MYPKDDPNRPIMKKSNDADYSNFFHHSFIRILGINAILLCSSLELSLVAQSFPPSDNFTLPAGKTIYITYLAKVNEDACPQGTVPPVSLSNQASVSGTNFSTVVTDDPDTPTSNDPTETFFGAAVIGNQVFMDNNRNGIFDAGDTGINDVTLNLYVDDGSGTLDINDGMPVATTTSATINSQDGSYTFNVCPGSYIIEVDLANFMTGHALYNSGLMHGLVSSPLNGAPDPDIDDSDNDDNGDQVSGFGVATAAFTVLAGVDNTHIDFGFKTPAQISIDDVSLMEGSPLGPTTFSFTVSRNMAESEDAVILKANTMDGSAVSVGDYNSFNDLQLSLGTSVSSVTIDVTIQQDEVVEDDETFHVLLSEAPAHAVIVDNSGTGTIENDDQATITLNAGSSQMEGNSGTVNHSFTATLSGRVQDGFSVAYSTSDGTATLADNDYNEKMGIISFSGSNNEMQTFTVTANGDNKVELDESFMVTLGAVSMTSPEQSGSIMVDVNAQSGTITNDDQAMISVSSASTNEGNSGTGLLNFTVTLNSFVDVGISMDYHTMDVTAIESGSNPGDNDYDAAAGMISFSGGPEQKTFAVVLNRDEVVELDETFQVILDNLNANGRNVVFSGGQIAEIATGTVLNDDQCVISWSGTPNDPPFSGQEGNSGVSSYDLHLDFSNPIDVSIALQRLNSDGTATLAGNDYLAGPVLFSLPAGDFQDQTFMAEDINGDLLVEGLENYNLEIAEEDFQGRDIVFNGGNNLTSTVEIIDDDIDFGDAPDPPYPTLLTNAGPSHGSSSLKLGQLNDGETNGQPTAMSDGDGNSDDGVEFTSSLVTGNIATVAVTASAPATLSAWIDFDGNGDFASSGDELFPGGAILTAGVNNLSFPVPNNATTGNSVARFRITTDGPVTYTGAASDGEVEDYQVEIINTLFSVNDPMVAEGNTGTSILSFSIHRTSTATASSVDYSITGGTATSGSDYQPLTSGTINFTANGSSVQMVDVVISGDLTVELDETVVMTLSNPSNGTIDDGEGVGIIINDDVGEVTISSPSVSEGSSGSSALSFAVELSNPSDAAVTLDFSTMDGLAMISDNDYSAEAGQLTIPAGETGMQIDVEVIGDCKIEPDEQLEVLLVNLQTNGRSISFAGNESELTGTGTILNDDSNPSLMCPGELIKLADCSTNQITFNLPVPAILHSCASTRLEYRYRAVDPSDNPLGTYSSYTSASSNTVTLGLGRYQVEWRLVDGSGITSCISFVIVNSVIPVAPAILGAVTICPGLINLPYSVSPQNGVTDYQWSYSGTGVTIHNNGTTNVTLDFAEGSTSGVLSVHVTDPCGNGSATGTLEINLGDVLTCAYTNCLIANRTVTTQTLNLLGMPQVFKTSNSIVSNATITAPRTVIFKTENFINLLPGFTVQKGAVFVAEIEGCEVFSLSNR